MFQKNNYLSGTTSERKNRTYNNIPQIIKSNTARVNAILIDTSDISEASFNPDSNEYLYTAYPAIADELEKNMSKTSRIAHCPKIGYSRILNSRMFAYRILRVLMNTETSQLVI